MMQDDSCTSCHQCRACWGSAWRRGFLDMKGSASIPEIHQVQKETEKKCRELPRLGTLSENPAVEKGRDHENHENISEDELLPTIPGQLCDGFSSVKKRRVTADSMIRTVTCWSCGRGTLQAWRTQRSCRWGKHTVLRNMLKKNNQKHDVSPKCRLNCW